MRSDSQPKTMKERRADDLFKERRARSLNVRAQDARIGATPH
jgi:hypothetical protein